MNKISKEGSFRAKHRRYYTKKAWCILAIIAVSTVLSVFVSRQTFGLTAKLHSSIDTLVIEELSKTEADKQIFVIASRLRATLSQNSENEIIDATNKRVIKIALFGDLPEVAFTRFLTEVPPLEYETYSRVFCVVKTGPISQVDVHRLQSLSSLVEHSKYDFLVLSDNYELVAAFLTQENKSSYSLWIAIGIGVFGALGGVLFSMGSERSFNLVLPFSDGETINTGFLGHAFAGALSGAVLCIMYIRAAGIDLSPIFKWPYFGDGFYSLAQLMSAAVIGGYLGISLIDKISASTIAKLGNEVREVKSEQDRLYQETSAIQAENSKNFEEIKKVRMESDRNVALTLALAAKSLYSAIYDEESSKLKANGRTVGSLLAMAESSNSHHENAIAWAMIGEIRRCEGNYAEAVRSFDAALACKADKDPNLKKPWVINYNRACCRSMINEDIDLIISDVKIYLEKDERNRIKMLSDNELAWARAQPNFRQAFNIDT